MKPVALKKLTGLQWSEAGYAALSGDLLHWAQKFDLQIGRWADDFGSTDYRFPALIPVKSLAPIAYLRSFPHQATFVTSGDRRETSLQALAQDCATADQISLSEDRFEPVEQLLTPAACYHFYPRFAGSPLIHGMGSERCSVEKLPYFCHQTDRGARSRNIRQRTPSARSTK